MADHREIAQPLPLAPTIGRGRYRLASKLGEGGMAAVYRTWDTREDAWRAIKVLMPEYSRRSKIRRRFENEATLMSRITHRHVIPVFDVGTDDALPFFVMELAEGGCIYDWTEIHGAMPPRMAVDITMQICKGVGAAHAAGVIHRDVKPHNVLVTRRGVCKVTDFGIAHLDDNMSITKTGSVMGTMGYMAPEQRTDSKNVDARADIYGIGATLYRLLTGGTVADLFLAEHDATMLEGVPECLVPVLLRASAYKPDDRYPSITEFQRALHGSRKALGPIPDGTPSVVLTLAEEPTGPIGTTQPTFPEIAEALRSPGQGGPTTGGGQEGSDPRIPRTADGEPLYVIEVPPEQARLDANVPQTPTLTPPTLTRQDEDRIIDAITPGPAGSRGGDAELTTQERAVQVVLRLLEKLVEPIAIAAIPILLFLAIGGSLVGFGATNVRAAASDAWAAQEAFYASITEEAAVMDELENLGSNPRALQIMYSDFGRMVSEPDRMQAALRYISAVEDQARRFATRRSAVSTRDAQNVQQRISRLKGGIATYEASVRAWEESTATARGRMAVQLGFAPRPGG